MQSLLSTQNRFSRLARTFCLQTNYQPLKQIFFALLFCTGFIVQAQSTYYVNDNSTANDVYTSAVGSDVNTGGSGDPFATIGYAISQASSGDTIYVDVGTYPETITVNKILTINGPQKDVDPRTAAALRTAGSASEAIVDGGGGATSVFNITSPDVILNGLEVRNATVDLIASPSGAPVKNVVIVKYCLVSVSGDEGIQLRNVDGGGVEYCRVFSTSGDGINLSSGCTNSYIQYNEVSGSASADASIYLYDNGPSMLVDNNLLTGNTGDNGIMIGHKFGSNSNSNSAFANNAVVSNNTVTGHAGSEVGVYINTSRVNVTDNTITGWESAGNAALYLRYDIKDIVVTDNIITGNVKGVKVSSGVSAANAPLISIKQNDLSANTDGMSNSSGGVANAQLNWWGNADGPSGSGPGSGTSVSTKVDFCPWLDAAPPAGMPTSTTGAVVNTTTMLAYCSIQAAIDDPLTLNGHTLVASAGTYPEIINVNKDLTIQGPNAGTAGNGVRVAEAVISDGKINILGANTVVIDGFKIYQTNAITPISLGGGAVATIQNNIIERFGSTTGDPIRGVEISAGAGAKTIANNLFTGDISGSLFSGHKTWNSGIYLNAAGSTVSITGNTFKICRTALNIDDMNVGVSISGNTFDSCGTYMAYGGTVATTGSYTLGANEYGSAVSALINLSNVNVNFRLDITAGTYDGTAFSALPLATLWQVESQMFHRTRSGRLGLVYYVANNQYVLSAVNNNIQTAIDYAVAGDVINIQNGSYNQRLVVSKSLTLAGESEAGTILDGTALGNGSGIYINNGITNVTIQDLTVQNFTGSGPNSNAGIYAVGGNDDLEVQHVTLKDNVGGSGFYANGPIDNVLLNNLDVSGHTNVAGAARGIVIWNGLKSNITITNCDVYNNNCCGIELQDGTATGVTMTGNNVYNNGDNGFGLTGMEGPGENVISGNTVTNNGRFGIEIKNPNGSGSATGAGRIVVENNNVSRNVAIADLRDIAGIAVFRRAVLAGNVDVPNGVVVQSNTVSGYVQGSTSDGFGIVIEGTNSSAFNNSINGNDVGLQLQSGHLPYPGDGNQNNVADDYFGRGNSPITCGITVSGNTFSGNGVDQRNVPASLATAGAVVNTNTNTTYCSIQAAIDDPLTLAGHTITVGAGTYLEDVQVHKANLNIIGAGIDKSIIDHSGQSGYNNSGVNITANGVTMKGFTVIDNDGGSVPRYGLKVGTSSVTTDDVTLDSVKVTQSFRTGFDLARPKNITLKNVFAISNGGAGVFMSNPEGASIESITTSGNPWTGVSISSRSDWPGDATGVVFTGTNSFAENAGKNGGVQIESDNTLPISWGNNIADGKDVTIQQSELAYALSGPTTNTFGSITYDPYFRFYQTLPQAQSAAGIGPDHVNRPRYIQDANCSTVPDSTNFYVYDFADTAMTIQAAVDAAVNGNTVNVDAGEYIEQIEITKDLSLIGQGKGVSTIKGFASMPLSYTTSANNVAVVYVHDANSVIVKDLTIDGDGQGNTNNRYQGIAYVNSGGFIGNLEVKAIRHTPLNGVQGGIGIFVDASAGTGRGVIVSKCMVHDFQKNGMSLSGADLVAVVDSNMVTGAGPLGLGLPAQNGIQYFGTNGGSITNNTVSDIRYTENSFVATGVLLFYGNDTIRVSGNTLNNVELGIYGFENNTKINKNSLDAGDYGIYVYAGDAQAAYTNIRNNFITNYDYAAFLQNGGTGTVDATVQENSITAYDSAAIIAFGTLDSVQAQCNWYGTANTAVVDAAISGQVIYQDYLLDGTDNDLGKGFQPVPGACKSANCADGSCDGCYTAERFNDPIITGPSQAPGIWYTDRYAPDSFYVAADSTLVHLIDAADAQAGFQGTQGRKYDLGNTTTMMSIDLYVPAAWASTGDRMAGFWGTAYNSPSDTISGYPIIEFVSDNADPRFRLYDNGVWLDMGLPCDFQYDAWHTLRIEVLPAGEFRFSVDDLRMVSTNFGNASSYFGNVILQGHNYPPGSTYQITWDNFIHGNGPTINYDMTGPDPIAIGSGLSNQHMAVGEFCGLSASLKAHKRFLGDVVPDSGDVAGDTYQFGTGVSPTDGSNTTPDPGTARWNYLVSVNLGTFTFNDLNVYLDIDFDNSDSACGVGPYVADLSAFMIANSMGGASVFQGSENLGFNFWQTIGDPAILPFDPYAEGTYDLAVRIENKDGVELMHVPIIVEVGCEFVEPSEDLEPPMLVCPMDTTIQAGQSSVPANTGMASVTGPCPQNLTYGDDESGLTGCNGTGTIVRTWYNEDSTQTCNQNIVVEDTTAPVLSACPTDTILFATGSAGASLMFDAPTAQDGAFFEGFENAVPPTEAWNAFNSNVVRVPTGSNGIPSKTGGYHATMDPADDAQTGAFTRLGGYSSGFGNGFTASQDIYIDLTDTNVTNNTYGFDISTAASNQAGNHLRDFIFHAASNASGNVLIAGSNNTNFTRRNDLGSLNNHEITTSGWYTFEWVFRDSSGSLAVDLNLKDASGNHLFTETRYNVADDISTIVGGNRYMWFTFLETSDLRIDNTSLNRSASVVCSDTSGATFPYGITTVTCVSTDACGNADSCSFNVTVVDTAGALNFDGANDVVAVPNDASLSGYGKAVTVEAWIRPEKVTGRQGIVGKWNDLSGTNRRSMLLWATDDDVQFYVSSTGSNFPSAIATNKLTIGEWTHVAGTFDGQTIRLYVDGVLSASTPFNGTLFNNTVDPLLIGAVDGGGSARQHFDGDIDEVRVYNRVLCAAEIQANMKCELSGGEAGLNAYYNFNQGIAGGDNTGLDTLIDGSSNSNTGDLQNFALNGFSSNWTLQSDSVNGACTPYLSPALIVYGNNQIIMDGDATADVGDSTDFGTVTVGETNTNCFFMVNTGTDVLNISSVNIIGGDATHFVISGYGSGVVNPGDSAQVCVNYTPFAAGAHSTTIEITSDYCVAATYDFAIKGEGFEQTCDTIRVITNSDWKMSTTVTQSSVSGNWSGVAGVLPDTSTFTTSVTFGQPYGYQTIFPVDSAQVIQAGNNIRYFHKSIFVDSLVDIGAVLKATFDDQIELYVNGKLMAAHYQFGGSNSRLPHFQVEFANGGGINNGPGGQKPFSFVTADTMDNIFKPGINDLILVLRNLDKPAEKGGFSLSLQVDGCEGVIAPPDTNVTPVDTICDTVGVVVNSDWMMSTTVTGTGVSGNWSGAMGNLPDTSTFTNPVVLGQPYSYQTIFPVDSSDVIKAGNNIRYFHKRVSLDSLVGIGARVRSTFDDQIEIYVNGNLLAGHYTLSGNNGKMPPFDAQFNSDGSVINGAGGNKLYGYATTDTLDNIFKPGINDLIVVLRNLNKPSEMGGFSLSLEVSGCQGDVVVDTNVVPKDTLTTSIVSDNGWEKSTQTEASDFNGNWSGASALPPTHTYTLPAVEGQPYGYATIDPIDSAKVIKTENNITFFRKTFDLTDNVGLDVRFRSNVDDGLEIYINGKLVTRDEDFGNINFRDPNHDLKFFGGTSPVNGFSGGDFYNFVTAGNLDTFFVTGANEVVVAVRNKAKASDMGGFSFRMDIDKGGNKVIVKTADATSSGIVEGSILDFEVYPNPTTGLVNIVMLGKLLSDNNEIIVQDVSGRVITRGTFESFAGEGGMQIDMSQFASGVYLIRVKSGDTYRAKRVMKK